MKLYTRVLTLIAGLVLAGTGFAQATDDWVEQTYYNIFISHSSEAQDEAPATGNIKQLAVHWSDSDDLCKWVVYDGSFTDIGDPWSVSSKNECREAVHSNRFRHTTESREAFANIRVIWNTFVGVDFEASEAQADYIASVNAYKLEQAEAANEDLQDDLDAAEDANEDLQDDLDAAEDANEELQSDLDDAEAANTELQSDLDEANADNEGLQSDLDEANAANTELQSDLDEAEADKAELQSDLDEANADKVELQSDLDEANAELEVKNDELAAANNELTEAEAELEAAKADGEASDAEIAALEAKVAEKEAEVAEAESKVAEKEAEVAEAESKVADAEAKVSNAEAELADAEQRVANAEKKLSDAEQEAADAKAKAERIERARAIAIHKLKDRVAKDMNQPELAGHFDGYTVYIQPAAGLIGISKKYDFIVDGHAVFIKPRLNLIGIGKNYHGYGGEIDFGYEFETHHYYSGYIGSYNAGISTGNMYTISGKQDGIDNIGFTQHAEPTAFVEYRLDSEARSYTARVNSEGRLSFGATFRF